MGSKQVVSDYLDDMLFSDERHTERFTAQDTIASGARLATAINILDYSALDNARQAQQRFMALLELLHVAKSLPPGRTHNYVLGHCQVLAAPVRKAWLRGRFDAYFHSMVMDKH